VFGVEADVKVEIVVGALDGTQRVVRGTEKYTYFGTLGFALCLCKENGLREKPCVFVTSYPSCSTIDGSRPQLHGHLNHQDPPHRQDM
jgi:hypothetical protein